MVGTRAQQQQQQQQQQAALPPRSTRSKGPAPAPLVIEDPARKKKKAPAIATDESDAPVGDDEPEPEHEHEQEQRGVGDKTAAVRNNDGDGDGSSGRAGAKKLGTSKASTNNGNDDEPEPEPEQEQRGATVNKTGPWRNINASRGGQTKANKADTSNTISQGGNTGEGGGGNSASGNKSSTQGSGQRNTAPAPKKGASVKMTSVRRVEADQAAELGNPGPLQPVERAIASSGMSVAPPPRPRQPIVSAAPILELPPPTRERRSALDDHHALQPVQKEAAKDVLPVDSVTNDENENEDLDQTNSNEEYEEEDSWQGFAGDKTIVPDDTPVRLAAGIRGAGNATSDDSSEEGEEEVKSEIDSDEFFGASRTVGGTMRGRARDKFCDPVAFDDMDVDVSPILKPLDPLDEATVYFFKSADTDDSMSNTIPVRKDSDLSAVLEELAKYFSPIKKRNSRIYVARTNGWAMKGRYELAVRSHEEIPWRENEAGETYVGIRADMDEIFDRDAAPPPPHSQVSSANASRSTSLVRASRDPSLAPPDESDTPERKRIRDRYAELLGIPDSLRQRHNIDLTYAWAKWECYHKVVDVMNELKKDKTPGKWDPKLKGGIELIDVFVSKTVWYDYYRKQFPRVYAFPHVKKYLSLVEGAPSSFELFGIEKTHYSFADLKTLLDELEEEEEEEKKKKEKGKGKDKDKGKGKAKASKKEKGKNSKSSDESDNSRNKKKVKVAHKKHSKV